MTFDVKELEAQADSGNLVAKNKLSALHIMGMFPGADPTEGLRLLEELATEDGDTAAKLELGILYFKGEKVERDQLRGVLLIEKAVSEFESRGEGIPFEHCFVLGMEFSQIKEEKYQSLSAKFLESVVKNPEGLKQIETHMGQQAVMMIKGMLQAVKGWLTATETGTETSTNVQIKTDSTLHNTENTEKPKLAEARKSLVAYRNCIALTSYHLAALKSDGTVFINRSSAGKEIEVDSEYASVANWHGIIAIAAGGLDSFAHKGKGGHLAGLRADGTVVRVGNGKNDDEHNNEVKKWRDIVALHSKFGVTYGLKADGTVVATGIYSDSISCWRNIVSITSSDFYTFGIRADGTIATANVGVDIGIDFALNAISNWQNIVDVVMKGNAYAVGLKSDGTVVVHERESHIFSGDSESANIASASSWTDIVAIEIGGHEIGVVGLKADGTVVTTAVDYLRPKTLWKNVIDIVVGKRTIFALTIDGKILTTEQNPSRREGARAIKLDCSDGDEICILNKDGTVYSSGVGGNYVKSPIRDWQGIDPPSKSKLLQEFKERSEKGLCPYCGRKRSGFFVKRCNPCTETATAKLSVNSTSRSYSSTRDDDLAKRLYNNNSDLRRRFDNFR